GELAYVHPSQRDQVLPVVQHLFENVMLLLRSGRFSVDPTTLRAGSQRLRVRVDVIDGVPAGNQQAEPNELSQLEYEPPSGDRPGRGSFALNSGRRVVGWVYIE